MNALSDRKIILVVILKVSLNNIVDKLVSIVWNNNYPYFKHCSYMLGIQIVYDDLLSRTTQVTSWYNYQIACQDFFFLQSNYSIQQRLLLLRYHVLL